MSNSTRNQNEIREGNRNGGFLHVRWRRIC
ncbi:Uncharacterised protein [Clostridium tertium]|uniref:Uncharacterized protein n=1 Tax=Clostridium tertium TaxID=1559 RepID=A0A6N2Z236_9CLOT